MTAHKSLRPQNQKRQSACKPGSVSSLPRRRPFLWTVRRRTVLATYPDALPRTGRIPDQVRDHRIPIRSCSRRGLPCPETFRPRRWALTPPFHHRLRPWFPKEPRRFRQTVLCGAIPKITLGGNYPPPYPRGARTFLDCTLSGVAAAAVRPTGACNVGSSFRD